MRVQLAASDLRCLHQKQMLVGGFGFIRVTPQRAPEIT
jgi:hypothetical protein